MSDSSKHPTIPPTASRRALALAPHQIHLVLVLVHSIRRLQRHLHLLLIPARDQFLLLQHLRVLEQFVLEVVVDVFLDDDELVVLLVRDRISTETLSRS